MLGRDIDYMDLRQVRYFVAVAEEQHFTRAAHRIGIEQSPLSRAIRALERDVGAVLFERSNKGSRLTPAGGTFLQHARNIIGYIDAAKVATLAVAGINVDCPGRKRRTVPAATSTSPETPGPDQ
jgi:DNA-binding transcriptional LysR family regulator